MLTETNQVYIDKLASFGNVINSFKLAVKDSNSFVLAEQTIFIDQLTQAAYLLYQLGLISLVQHSLISAPESIYREGFYYFVDFQNLHNIQFHYRCDLLYTMAILWRKLNNISQTSQN